MAGNFYDKFPDEIIEFDVDASDILINGDTISQVAVDVLGGGITAPGSSFSGAIIKVVIAGGTAGGVAHAVANVTLASGQYRQALIAILIKRLPTS